MLTDAHTHLHDKKFSKIIDQVIRRAKEENIVTIINNGIDYKSNRETLELAEKYDIIEPALGIHPTEISKTNTSKEIDFIESQKDKIIAIGEIGLDKHWNPEELESQKEVFIKLLKLAEKIKKPVIIHSRKAEKEVIEMLQTTNLKHVVLHSFNGNFNLVKKAENLGYKFSIPVSIMNSHHFQNMVNQLSISSILTETDAPYLSPFKKLNEPSYIRFTIKKISEIKKLSLPEVEKLLYMNFQDTFYSSSSITSKSFR